MLWGAAARILYFSKLAYCFEMSQAGIIEINLRDRIIVHVHLRFWRNRHDGRTRCKRTKRGEGKEGRGEGRGGGVAGKREMKHKRNFNQWKWPARFSPLPLSRERAHGHRHKGDNRILTRPISSSCRFWVRVLSLAWCMSTALQSCVAFSTALLSVVLWCSPVLSPVLTELLFFESIKHSVPSRWT